MATGLFEKRIRYLVAVSLVLLVTFSIRLVDVQAVRAAGYANRADLELAKKSIILAPRGSITDVNGIEFARSVTAYRLLVDQAIIDFPDKLATIAAPILKMDKDYLKSKLIGERRYVVISQSVQPAVWRKLQEAIAQYNEEVAKKDGGFANELAGFFAERIYSREYPQGGLAAAVIGFVNQSGAGAAGLEYSLNSTLAGVNGEYTYANAAGTIIPGTQKITVEEKRGNTIRLTIDRDIQWIAQREIRKAVTKARAQSGTVIVMDPATGAILAHATFPTFEPGKTRGVDSRRWQNPSVQEVYEPGSTGKVITFAAAMEEGKVSPETVLTVPDKIKRYDKVFHDHDPHPVLRLTLTGALAQSSNVASIKVGEMISHEKLHDYLIKFGIASKTGSGLPGEESGKLLEVSQWSGTTAPTVAFGQGYSLTAMQATSVFATIANDGVRVAPTLIAGITDAGGRFSPNESRKSERIISSQTASQLSAMMESVVSSSGTAPQAAISGYRVAGKTGTARRIDDSCGCYRGYTSSFIGFAPADNPKYVASVTIQDPKGVYYGGYLGGPVFSEVMGFVLRDQRIAPSAEVTVGYALNERELKKKS
ncbi:MAG TPA: penicillin-binding protein 2 [Candidatus Nanopelagicaceae bacterium]|jgi:cell division protein FtsI (penicillin-binding protein 3)